MENSKTLHSAAPMVSICCLVYNHESFLRECFDGFVKQQTTFPIEILVHDDASTDHSADIIREYTAKYPDLFKPIYQTENQYSKGKGFVGITLNIKRAKGKYIAMCEGDDYWTDPMKLQKQVEFLEKNEKCTMTCCRVKRFSESKKKFIEDYGCYDSSQYANVVDVIEEGGLFISTCSIVYRPEIQENYPEYCKKCHVGDFPLQIMAAMKGGIFYFNDTMAVYRVDNPYSWAGSFANKEYEDKFLIGIKSEIRMLQGFCTDYPRFKKNYENRIKKYIISNIPDRELNPDLYRKFRKEIGQLGFKIRIYLLFKTSRLKRIYYALRNRM